MSLAHLRRLAGIGEPSAYRDVDEAIQPVGTVHSRKDGDWVKTADGWVRVKKKDKAAVIGTKTPPKVSRTKKTTTAPAPAPAPAPVPAPSAPAPLPVKAPSAPSTPAQSTSETPEQAKARRDAAAKKIGPVLNSALKRFDDFNAAEFDEKAGGIYASFRDWNLDKDPPYEDDSEDEDGYSADVEDYYNRADEIAINGRKHLKSALASHMDSIQNISVAHGDKNWFDVFIKLK